MATWYVYQNNTQIGPLSLEQLIAMNPAPSTMVWCEGMPQWLQASQIPELAHLFNAHNAQQAYRQPGEQFNNFQNPNSSQYPNSNTGFYVSQSGRDKTTAGVLALLLGWIGAQYFYIGKTGAAFLTILLSLVTCGLWNFLTFAQGIVMLTMTQEQFDQKYVYSNSTMPLF